MLVLPNCAKNYASTINKSLVSGAMVMHWVHCMVFFHILFSGLWFILMTTLLPKTLSV